MNYCEWNAAERAADPTLRTSCAAPAAFAMYGAAMPNEPVYVCSAHRPDVRAWLLEDMPTVNVLPLTDAARAEVGAQREPLGGLTAEIEANPDMTDAEQEAAYQAALREWLNG